MGPVSFKDLLDADVAVFLNTSEFADRVTYNGAQIDAVFEPGPDAQAGNAFTGPAGHGQADRAVLWVRVTDVSAPRQGDRVNLGANEWRVARVLESGGGMHKLECTAREAVGW